MKICILVHSKSGNTRKFADSLLHRLINDGHEVQITQLETTVPIQGGSVRQKMDIQLTNLPSVQEADLILLGGPVWAFGPSPVIIAAIKQLGKLSGKKALSFVTMGFPLKGMGGKAAVNAMNTAAATQGAKIVPGSICCQMFHNLDDEISKETGRIAELIVAT